jgi:hypothetical protein
MPCWPMAIFGLLASESEFWIWHRVSPRLGFGAVPAEISMKHAYIIFAIATLMTTIGVAFGNRGL